jgi:predicted nucleic acid-binding protein
MNFTTVTRVTVDTNILIYAVDVDADSKHALAAHIVKFLSEQKSVLPLQCLTEFYRATTKKRRFAAAEAASFVQQFRASMLIIPAAIEDLAPAMHIHQQHKIQFFDALLIATTRRAGCTVFLSEDLQDGRNFDGVTVRNPFVLSSEELNKLLS